MKQSLARGFCFTEVLLYVLLIYTQPARGTVFQLANDRLTARFGERGLESIQDHALGRTYHFAQDGFSITINEKMIRSRDLKTPAIERQGPTLIYRFQSYPYCIEVVYEIRPGWSFVSKQLVVTVGKNTRAFTVNDAEVLRERLQEVPSGHFIVKSFWRHSPGVETKDYALFLRLRDQTGMMMVVQNPFLEVTTKGNEYSIDYQPQMEWKTSYGPFKSDRGLIGTYKLTGEMVPTRLVPEWLWIQGNAPPGPEEDEAEIKAFENCVKAFVLPHPRETVKIDVGWTENDYQINVATAEGRKEYKRVINRAAQLGFKYVLYAPSNTALAERKYDADSWHWEHVLWLGLGQKIREGKWNPASSPVPASVQEMLAYAKSKGVKLVAYVYPDLPFAGNPAWLVRQQPSQRLFGNLANRDLQDWLIQSLLEFYRRTGIGGYAFDYTLLSLPGASTYAQWWGWRRVMETIRRAKPSMVIDGRQTYQHYGPWSWLAGSYPHPTSTDEQAESFIPFPDLHFDRVSADRERYTAYRYRVRDFCPPELTPGFIGHQTPRNNEQGHLVNTPFRRRDWDYLGWKYSLISSIAVAGFNNVGNMLPARDPAEYECFSQSDINFYRHWLDWTDANRAFLMHTRFIIGQPQIGHIDGTSALIGSRGYIFLFNPNGPRLNANFRLNSAIGLQGEGELAIEEIYPRERWIGKAGTGYWRYGDEVTIPMEGASAMALKVMPAPSSSIQPVLFNEPGNVLFAAGKLTLSSVRGEIGTCQNLTVLMPRREKVRQADVNGHPAKFAQSGSVVMLSVRFKGTRFSHMQQVGEYDPHFAGGTVRARFTIPERIFKQIKARQKAWPIPWTLADTKTPWLEPQRLLLFVQIAQPSDQMHVELKLNGKPVPLTKAYASIWPHPRDFVGFYADASKLEINHPYNVELDLPHLKQGQFQGLFFENVVSEYTDRTVGGREQ